MNGPWTVGNGAGQPTYRVVMVSVDRVVPVWASETQPSAMCVICHLTLPPSDAHGGLCCRHKYDAQPLCPSCSVTDAERYKLFEQGAEIAQRLDWERDQLECLAADAFGGQG